MNEAGDELSQGHYVRRFVNTAGDIRWSVNKAVEVKISLHKCFSGGVRKLNR